MFSSARNLRSETSALKWLILIGLLCAQTAYAGHQIAHGIDELAETCQVCTGYEHFETALSDEVYASPLPATPGALSTCFAILEAVDRQRFYSARASPQTPDNSF